MLPKIAMSHGQKTIKCLLSLRYSTIMINHYFKSEISTISHMTPTGKNMPNSNAFKRTKNNVNNSINNGNGSEKVSPVSQYTHLKKASIPAVYGLEESIKNLSIIINCRLRNEGGAQ